MLKKVFIRIKFYISKLAIYMCTMLFILSLHCCGYIEVDKKNTLIQELDEKYKKENLSYETVDTYLKEFSLWYRSFNNEELNTLIDIVLNNNLDIAKAVYNLKASSYNLWNQRSALMPSLNLESQAMHQKQWGYNIKASIIEPENNSINIGLKASYEIDIWGKNYAAYKGADSHLKAQEEDFANIKISIVASMMNLWVNLMALREQKEVLKNKIDYAESMLNLQQSNYTGGTISITDLLHQESQILEYKNKLEEIEYYEQETLRSINILCGKDPLDKIEIKSKTLPKINQLPVKDINIQILSNRPDIKSAFHTVIANKWEEKVAKLNMLPHFTVSPQIGVLSDNFYKLLDNWLIQVVVGGAIPLFKGGAVYGSEQAAKFLSKASVVNYKKVVFNAINEFKTALDNEEKYNERIKNLQMQVNLIEEATIQLQNKYLNGDSDYIEYLLSSNKVNDLKIAAIEQEKDRLLNRIILYRTLGIAVEKKEQRNDKV